MKKVYFLLVLTSTFLLCLFYCYSFYRYTNLAPAKIQQETQVPDSKEVSLQNTVRIYEYYLLEVDGYIHVYKADKTSLYMITTIEIEELPEKLRREVKKGKEIKDEEELFSFLENYSS